MEKKSGLEGVCVGGNCRSSYTPLSSLETLPTEGFHGARKRQGPDPPGKDGVEGGQSRIESESVVKEVLRKVPGRVQVN